jgi:hypothetical protein
MEKYRRDGQATDDNMTFAHCTLDTQIYKYTLRICNIYCVSTATELQVRPSVLRYTYIASLIINNNFMWLHSIYEFLPRCPTVEEAFTLLI